jgi:predicted Rossmann fold nucleotide-binding protein DprA/Smf involved in DNA uptake
MGIISLDEHVGGISMTDAQQKILDALERDRFVSTVVLASLTRLPLEEVQEELPQLEIEKKVKYIPFTNEQGIKEKAYYLASV